MVFDNFSAVLPKLKRCFNQAKSVRGGGGGSSNMFINWQDYFPLSIRGKLNKNISVTFLENSSLSTILQTYIAAQTNNIYNTFIYIKIKLNAKNSKHLLNYKFFKWSENSLKSLSVLR